MRLNEIVALETQAASYADITDAVRKLRAAVAATDVGRIGAEALIARTHDARAADAVIVAAIGAGRITAPAEDLAALDALQGLGGDWMGLALTEADAALAAHAAQVSAAGAIEARADRLAALAALPASADVTPSAELKAAARALIAALAAQIAPPAP